MLCDHVGAVRIFKRSVGRFCVGLNDLERSRHVQAAACGRGDKLSSLLLLRLLLLLGIPTGQKRAILISDLLVN